MFDELENLVIRIADRVTQHGYSLEYIDPVRPGKDVPAIEVVCGSDDDAYAVAEMAEQKGMYVDLQGFVVYIELYG